MDFFRRSLTSLREPGVSVSPILVEVLKHDRAMVSFGLAIVAILSWTYRSPPEAPRRSPFRQGF